MLSEKNVNRNTEDSDDGFEFFTEFQGVREIALLRERLVSWEERTERGQVEDLRDWRDIQEDTKAIELAESFLSAAGFDFTSPRSRLIEKIRRERKLEKQAAAYAESH